MSKPKIRFKGYVEDWEQRKLSDVAEFSKGNGYSKGDLAGSGTPIILYGRLYTKYETVIREIDTFVEPKESSVYSKGGEVIIPASGETAEYKNTVADKVLKLWDKLNLTDFIYEMYDRYHTERIENVFEDIDKLIMEKED